MKNAIYYNRLPSILKKLTLSQLNIYQKENVFYPGDAFNYKYCAKNTPIDVADIFDNIKFTNPVFNNGQLYYSGQGPKNISVHIITDNPPRMKLTIEVSTSYLLIISDSFMEHQQNPSKCFFDKIIKTKAVYNSCYRESFGCFNLFKDGSNFYPLISNKPLGDHNITYSQEFIKGI